MPPYRYDTFNPGPRYDDRYAGAIAGTLRDMGTLRAQTALSVADANARATAAQGDIWGRAIGSIGQAVGNIPLQMQQAQQDARRNKILDAQLADAERTRSTRDRVNALMSDPDIYDPEGGINMQTLQQRMTQLPEGASGPTQPVDAATLFDVVGPINQHLTAARTAKSAWETSKQQAVAKMAHGVLQIGSKTGDFVGPGQIAIGSLVKSGLMSQEDGTRMLTGLVEQPAEVTAQQLQELATLGGVQPPKRELHNVPPGNVVIDERTMQPIYTNPAAEKPVNKQYQTKEMLLDGKTRATLSFDPDTNQWFQVGSAQPLDPTRVATAPPEVDPTVAAIRNLTLETARQNAQDRVGQLPKGVQQQVDIRTKAFESQPVVKRATTMAEAVNFANGLDINTKNPADDQALIYAFAKAMDPDSVVREGEYATVQKYAQSWAQSLGFDAARVFSNTPFLTAQARQNMKTTIGAKFTATQQQYDAVRQSFATQINRKTGRTDGDTYLTDYGAAFPGASAGTDARGGGQIIVTAPDGSRHPFDTQAEADAFKRVAGIR